MRFPGRSQLDNPYPDVVRSENVTASAEARRIEAARLENAQRLAVARHYLKEVSVDELEAVGSLGRRWRIDGEDWLLSEAFLDRDQDPGEAGVERYFVDRNGAVVYLRRPQPAGQRSLHEATRGGRVVGGNILVDVTGEGETVRLR